MQVRAFYVFGLASSLITGCLSADAGYRRVPAPPAEATGASTAAPETADLFERRTFQAAAGGTLPYRLLTPPVPRAGQRYPLVVCFHGSGAIGTDNEAQLGAFVRTWAAPGVRERFPAYVVAPQFPARSANYAPDPADGLLQSVAAPTLADALALVDSLRAALPVDPDRIYAVGFSMGASTAWHALLQRRDLIAAAVTIAGVPPAREAAPRLADAPVLIVHGNADTENPIEPDQALYRALQSAGARRVRFREYEGLDHRIPADLMTEPAWRHWLFQQHR